MTSPKKKILKKNKRKIPKKKKKKNYFMWGIIDQRNQNLILKTYNNNAIKKFQESKIL